MDVYGSLADSKYRGLDVFFCGPQGQKMIHLRFFFARAILITIEQ
jgi:hypothetical protein